MTLGDRQIRGVLAAVVIVLLAVPVGGALWLGFVAGDSPCILCWAERTSMILIALVGLFVVRYGPRPRYVGTVILLGAWGAYMGLRHSALHLARDVGQGFAAPILGVHTYVWAFVIHLIALAAIAVLLIVQREEPLEAGVRDPGPVGRVAFALFIVVVALNAVQAFATTGIPPWIGQGDPVRFSFNPKHWVRTNEETDGRISLRGSWAIGQPDLAALDPDPAHGPLRDLPSLRPEAAFVVPLPAGARWLTGFARDSATGRFAITTDRWDVRVLDSARSAGRGVVVDPEFSVDLTPPAGVAFVGDDSLVAVATNKSYVGLRRDPAADPEPEWRHFLATDGGVRELARSRFATIRARQNYVRSLAFDPAAHELLCVAVPNPLHPQLVVSSFALGDLTLSAEFLPRLAPPLALALRDSTRSLAEYVVTGAVVSGRTLWAISARYSTLLAIDLGDHAVRGAWTIPGLERPIGIAVRGADILVAQQDGRVFVIPGVNATR